MKTITIILAIVWAIATVVPGQEAGSDSGVAAKIRGLEYARFDAQRHKDNVTLAAMFDNALVWVDPDGVQLTKADYLANLRLASAKRLEIGPESLTVHVFENTAVVIGIYHVRSVKGGRPYLQRIRFINTWAFKNGKWVCIAAVATLSLS